MPYWNRQLSGPPGSPDLRALRDQNAAKGGTVYVSPATNGRICKASRIRLSMRTEPTGKTFPSSTQIRGMTVNIYVPNYNHRTLHESIQQGLLSQAL